MKLQQGTRCAILAVLHMAARPGEQTPASEIAEIYGVSLHHLAKVLRTLSHAGIVASTRGAGGGCSFIGDARRITLHDLIRLFEPDRLSSGRNQPEAPTAVATELRHVLGEVDRHTSATLQSVTLQAILKAAERRERRRLERTGAGPGEAEPERHGDRA